MIYLDNAATTKVSDEVLSAMLPYYTQQYGNASSIYQLGYDSRRAIDRAREQIAAVINAKPEEIYFTSGGTEADNWAVRIGRGDILYSPIEHHAVIHSIESTVTSSYPIKVDGEGRINLKELNNEVRLKPSLVSVMTANNEIGTIQPIKEIGENTRKNSVSFHTDAVQAFGQIPIDVKAMNIDMLSASGHKIHAPKGIGFLYIRDGIKTEPLIYGGGQERGMRSGTENVPAIVGLGVAAKHMAETMEERSKYLTSIRDYMIERLITEIPDCKLNGSRKNRLPNNVNISFQYVEGESLVLALASKGICASAGSACTAGSLNPSHVLKAIGLSDEMAHGALRLTLSEYNTMKEAEYTVDTIKKLVESFRKMNPNWWRASYERSE